MNYAVLLSGGTGTRTGLDKPKQYLRCGKHMMVTHSLRAVLSSELVDAVYIVADPLWRDEITADIKDAGLDSGKIRGFSDPGENRQCSVFNGLKSILSDIDAKMRTDSLRGEDSVLIHDAARPFLTVDLLRRCYDGLKGFDGVMPVLPMKDTVYLSRDGASVSELLNREEIFAGQAPELFNLRKYYEANEKLLPDRILKINGASEPAIMAGMSIAMIPGDEGNYKVTTNADVKRFSEIIEREQGFGS